MPRATRRSSGAGLLSALVLAGGLLTAGATTDPARAGVALVTPLHDLNLVGAEIPAVLAAAQRAP